jgi:transcriptional regulator with XRE-family HTH domain
MSMDFDYGFDAVADLALNILDVRRGMGWTQAELARRAGVSERTVRNIENLQFSRKPQLATLRKLASALGATTEMRGTHTVVRWPREALERGKSIAREERKRDGPPATLT